MPFESQFFDVKTIGKHINNALREELSEQNSVVAKFATTSEEKEMMISVVMHCMK